MNELLKGLVAVVQYRRKLEATWHTMAAYDSLLMAESYCAAQRTDKDWPWVYQVIELPQEEI